MIALGYIYGIGRNNAQDIVKQAGISESKRVHQLSESEVIKIREIIDRDYTVEGDLRREVAMNIKRQVDLGTYRGATSCKTRNKCRE